MITKSVWMVEWADDYADCNAVFSTRDKAIAYIESEAKRMDLNKRNFGVLEESEEWGIYQFDPDPDWGEDRVQSVTYMFYPVDAYD